MQNVVLLLLPLPVLLCCSQLAAPSDRSLQRIKIELAFVADQASGTSSSLGVQANFCSVNVADH
jgi:hypothetical protein